MIGDLLALGFFASWHVLLVRVVFRADRRFRALQAWRESLYLAGVRAGQGVRNAPRP